MTLLTKRLILRPFREDDAQAIYEYSKDLEVGLNAGWKPHESVAESDDILHIMFLNQPTVWAIERASDKRLMGSVGIIHDPKREDEAVRMLGYALGMQYWGQGYMSEAAEAVLNAGFYEMGLELISATCYPDNDRSRRVLEKCGFQCEGTIHHAERLWNGELRDHLSFYLEKGGYEKTCHAWTAVVQ